MTRRGSDDFTVEEIFEAVEAAAAIGERHAAWLLRSMIERRQRTGDIHLFERLAALRYLLGDPHRPVTRKEIHD